eukprot:CAMPEP_0170510688 /NCGR_PEP_ID=MMETSP0208-20121228/65902_1 /TAXON_ID=197538 /ORGANISM="Strombidium inclinatum, Strain S3" /LENGTH=105 /DNA_ID=CAMNT_0010794173 /DNA_START=1149 /DNA_END=1462 /DNA_ORIENTATION=+
MVVAGVFALFPTPAYKTFGSKKAPQIYSLVLLCSFFASLTDTILMRVVYESIGAENIFYIGAVASVVGMLIGIFFEERLDIENMDKRGLVVWGDLKEEFKWGRQA